jgi:predicted RNase H-like nuclease
MIFLGVDLGWVNGATGLAALEFRGESLRLKALGLAADHPEVLRWIRDQAADGPAMIAIDAPTIIRNATGQRPGERLLNAALRCYGLNCHPANLGRPFAWKTTQFSLALESEGFRHADSLEPRRPGRYQIEVFPHASIVRFFGLDYRLKYKKGSVAERVVQLRRLRRFLYRLKDANPPCILKNLPEVPAGGIARKHVEEQLDAIICAYTGAHYWFWGHERNTVFGDAEAGFLVIPSGEFTAVPARPLPQRSEPAPVPSPRSCGGGR